MFSETFYAQHSVTKNLHVSSRFWPTISYQDANSVLLLNSTLLYSSVIRLYPQNPVLKIVHDKSVKAHLPMYNGDVQQNEPSMRRILCHLEIFHVSPVLVNDFLSRCKFSALTSTPLYSSRLYMRRKPFVRFFIKM